MPSSRGRSQVFFWLTLAFLLISIHAYQLIPYWSFRGVDLQNHFAFHHCAFRDQPYGVPGRVCLDVIGRDMIYPPPLYWAFAWTRRVTFDEAVTIWTYAIPLMLFPLMFAWTTEDQRRRVGLPELIFFWLLMLVQYPVLFAMERGNSDSPIVVLWTIALIFFRVRWIFFAGLFAGLSAAFKLYPAVSCAIVGLGMLVAAPGPRLFNWRYPLAYGVGCAIGVIAPLALFYEQSSIYFKTVLPRFARSLSPLEVYSHPIPALAEAYGHPAWASRLSLTLTAIWALTSVRRMRHDPIIVFAGALAIATYFSGVSYDCNLVTAYPLLLALFAYALRGNARSPSAMWALLGIGLLSVVGDRFWFLDPHYLKLHVVLQVLWLAATGLYFALYERTPENFAADASVLTSPAMVPDASSSTADAT